ncbi:hypothetical protein ABIE53_005957 [Burkholderia sp. OAS925]
MMLLVMLYWATRGQSRGKTRIKTKTQLPPNYRRCSARSLSVFRNRFLRRAQWRAAYLLTAGCIVAMGMRNSEKPVSMICTPMHNSRNDDTRIATFVPSVPRYLAKTSERL